MDLNIESTDNSTYFSITTLDIMQKPEKTMRFDKNTVIEYRKWIQDRFRKSNTISGDAIFDVDFYSKGSFLFNPDLTV